VLSVIKSVRILKLNQNIIDQTVRTLQQGGLVIFPSDTVYGLLVDATNEKAVNKLIQFKNRPPGKAISVFLSDFKMMEDFTTINNQQLTILHKLLPGPFTIILSSKHKVSKKLESEKGTLGIRIPAYQLINKLIQKYGKPITATSANLSGRSVHYSVESLLKVIPEKKRALIDLIIDGGKLPRNKPSTIVDLTTPNIKILRQGDVLLKSSKSYISKSALQTKKIGEFLLNKYREVVSKKPLIFIIEGELGVGKTIMVKGIGERLNIFDIVSPTYVVYYEYPVKKNGVKIFYHFDLYNLQDKEEFQYLGIEKLLLPGNILCFEWGEKTGEIYETLKSKANVVYVGMRYVSKSEREIIVNDN
jgi:L-threonylcarbamoyladenylate synthase